MTNLLISHNFKTMKCPVVSGTFRTLAADPLGPVGCGLSGLFCNPWMLMGLGNVSIWALCCVPRAIPM